MHYLRSVHHLHMRVCECHLPLHDYCTSQASRQVPDAGSDEDLCFSSVQGERTQLFFFLMVVVSLGYEHVRMKRPALYL